MYGLDILHQRDKRVKTKSQRVLGANSYVCRSYRGKPGRGGLFAPPPILNRVKITLIVKSECQQNQERCPVLRFTLNALLEFEIIFV